MQKNARLARLAALSKYCYNNNIIHLFLGHHYDDNLETFALRKVAGSNFEGLKKRFIEVIEQNNYLNEKEWMDFGEKYFINFKNNINGFQLVKKNIKKIFDENKLLSDTKLN